MSEPLAPHVRLQFAKRLKEIRAQRGFPRARYFAKSLGIEENRYTRYERAEVEPSLSLIHKMCETLHITPNELMGYAEYGEQPPVSAFAEGPAADGLSGPPTAQHAMGSLAWRLAAETTAIRSRQRSRSKSGDPLAAARDTGKLFQSLQADPFGTVAKIVEDEALKSADPERKAAFASLIEAFTESISEAVGGHPAR